MPAGIVGLSGFLHEALYGIEGARTLTLLLKLVDIKKFRLISNNFWAIYLHVCPMLPNPMDEYGRK